MRDTCHADLIATLQSNFKDDPEFPCCYYEHLCQRKQVCCVKFSLNKYNTNKIHIRATNFKVCLYCETEVQIVCTSPIAILHLFGNISNMPKWFVSLPELPFHCPRSTADELVCKALVAAFKIFISFTDFLGGTRVILNCAVDGKMCCMQ